MWHRTSHRAGLRIGMFWVALCLSVVAGGGLGAAPAAAHPWAARASYIGPTLDSSPTLYPHSWGFNPGDKVMMTVVPPTNSARVSSWLRGSYSPTQYGISLNGTGVIAHTSTARRWTWDYMDYQSFNLYAVNIVQFENTGVGPRVFMRSLRVADLPEWSSYSAALDVTSTEFPEGSGLNGVVLLPYAWEIPVSDGQVSVTFKTHNWWRWGGGKVRLKVIHRALGGALGVVDLNGTNVGVSASPGWTKSTWTLKVNRNALNRVDLYNDGPLTAGAYQVKALRIW